ncbi:MAG: ankyrin repeat domain-containing protein [Deltaproteobacteria bacterium]|nr:ankyrin repeat domain-containing protein [Deltaproteobacteria bacterium]
MGRALAGEFFTKRYYASNTEGTGFLADLDGKIKSAGSVFIPMSSVDSEAPLFPLEVAVRNTPHPEVVTILLDAGAPAVTARVADYLGSRDADPEIGKILLSRSAAGERCESLLALARNGDMAMADYCLELEGMSVNYRSESGAYPLLRAIEGGQTAMAAYLLERGAAIPQDADGRLELLGASLNTNNPDGFRLLLDKGLDCSEVDWNGKNTLMWQAYRGSVKDASVLAHLAGTVPLDEKNAARALDSTMQTGDAGALAILMGRIGKGPAKGGAGVDLLDAALRGRNRDVFWKLVAAGADCSRTGTDGRNELMLRAAWFLKDKDVAEHLARHVPVEGEAGSSALAYAVKMGWAESVRILLERGAVGRYRRLSVPEDAPERDAVRELLAAQGMLE